MKTLVEIYDTRPKKNRDWPVEPSDNTVHSIVRIHEPIEYIGLHTTTIPLRLDSAEDVACRQFFEDNPDIAKWVEEVWGPRTLKRYC